MSDSMRSVNGNLKVIYSIAGGFTNGLRPEYSQAYYNSYVI